MLPLVPRLPAMAKALFVFPRCGGRCLVSLQLTFPAMASSHSSDLNLLLPTGFEAQAWFFPLPSQILWLLSTAQDMNCLDHSSQKVGDAETSDRGHGMMWDLCSDKNLHGCAISELSWKKVSWGTHTPIFCPFLPHLNL